MSLACLIPTYSHALSGVYAMSFLCKLISTSEYMFNARIFLWVNLNFQVIYTRSLSQIGVTV